MTAFADSAPIPIGRIAARLLLGGGRGQLRTVSTGIAKRPVTVGNRPGPVRRSYLPFRRSHTASGLGHGEDVGGLLASSPACWAATSRPRAAAGIGPSVPATIDVAARDSGSVHRRRLSPARPAVRIRGGRRQGGSCRAHPALNVVDSEVSQDAGCSEHAARWGLSWRYRTAWIGVASSAGE